MVLAGLCRRRFGYAVRFDLPTLGAAQPGFRTRLRVGTSGPCGSCRLDVAQLRDTLSAITLIFFGIGVIWVYLLALLSIPRLAAKLRPGTVRLLRTVGVEYIAFAFLVDFAKNPFRGSMLHLLAYLPFLALAAAGPLSRLAATAKGLARLQGSRCRAGVGVGFRGVN